MLQTIPYDRETTPITCPVCNKTVVNQHQRTPCEHTVFILPDHWGIQSGFRSDEVAEENIQGLHTEKDVNNSILNKSLSGDITSITITISGVDPVNVDVSSGETVSKTIDGVPVGQQTVKIDLKDS